MMQSKLIKTSIAKGFATGVLWLSLGAAYAVAEPPVDFVTPGTRMDRFTATVATDRIVFTTATEIVPIPGTKVDFVQFGSKPQAVVVDFIAEWPKPRPDEIPAGTQASGVFIFLFIDGNRVDPISPNGGVLVHEGTASSVSNGTHGFTFVTDPLPPGKHEAEIRALGNVLTTFGVPASTFVVGNRSTVVQHD